MLTVLTIRCSDAISSDDAHSASQSRSSSNTPGPTHLESPHVKRLPSDASAMECRAPAPALTMRTPRGRLPTRFRVGESTDVPLPSWPAQWSAARDDHANPTSSKLLDTSWHCGPTITVPEMARSQRTCVVATTAPQGAILCDRQRVVVAAGHADDADVLGLAEVRAHRGRHVQEHHLPSRRKGMRGGGAISQRAVSRWEATAC